MNQPSTFLIGAFIAVTLAVATAIVAIAQRAYQRGSIAGYFLTIWLGLTVALAGQGMLRFEPRPSIVVIIAAALALALYVSLSRIGARVAETVPMTALILFQAFRLPLALLTETRLDIVAGATAIAVAFVAKRRAIVLVWNILGIALLASYLDPANSWITRPPFVWLVALLVPAALAGHIVIFRKLSGEGTAG
jgi:hypothetical protein